MYKKPLVLIFVFLYTIFNGNSQVNPTKNIISMDISTFPESAAFNYDSCMNYAQKLGIRTIGITQMWSTLEPTKGTYNFSIIDIADYYYPLKQMPLNLSIVPINTTNKELPADLFNKNFDDPEMISRFRILLDSIKVHSKNIVFHSLIIGSEQDVYFQGDTVQWNAYKVFYDSAISHAGKIWPGIKVATEITHGGFERYLNLVKKTNENSNYIGVSYYPLNSDNTVKNPSSVKSDLTYLTQNFSKPICFYQYGYPSSVYCKSSEKLQADFIKETFKVWDSLADKIYTIDFTWLHDLSQKATDDLGKYYGIKDTAFLEFLRTLGLREWNGTGKDKPAMNALICETAARGFNQLKGNCSNIGISETKESEFYIYPNPFNQYIQIESLNENENIYIFNSSGKLIETIYQPTSTLHLENLPDGFYFLELKSNSGSRFKIIVKVSN